ncbi:anaerobic ribonucleoside-triphosphate reductase [Arthrospira platensis SPKY2]
MNLNPHNFELYSNQYIPLTLTNKQNGDLVSIYDRLYIQGLFDSFTTGGAICHINIDDSQPLSSTQNKLLIETAKDLGVVYFAINYVFSQSESDVFSIGKHDICPITGENIKYQYSRVVGYLTNEQNWKLERREEFKKRNFYSLPS